MTMTISFRESVESRPERGPAERCHVGSQEDAYAFLKVWLGWRDAIPTGNHWKSWGELEDVIGIFIVSPCLSWITGQSLIVTPGCSSEGKGNRVKYLKALMKEKGRESWHLSLLFLSDRFLCHGCASRVEVVS